MDSMVLFLEAMPGRLFGLDQQTLIQIGIQLFNACVLAVALSLILYKPVRDFLQKRRDNIKARLDRAEEDMAKAQKLITQYEAKLWHIDRERMEILTDARKQASEKSKQIIEEAKEEAETIKERAAAEIENERENIKEDLKLYIIEVAAGMAGKYVAHTIDQDTRDRLLAETLRELEEATWLN